MYSLTQFIEDEKSCIECEKKAIDKLIDYLSQFDVTVDDEQTDDRKQNHHYINNTNVNSNDLRIRETIDNKSSKKTSLRDSHLENNKRIIDSEHSDIDYITPRNRLLTTYSSRLRAQKYREELLKQIEDNKRRKAEEIERIKKQDMELERKIEEQRRKMMIEYEFEQKHARKKTDAIIKKQEMINVIQDNRNDIFPVKSRQTLLRSPSYLLNEYRATLRSPFVHKLDGAKRSLDKTLFLHSKDNLLASAANTSANISEEEHALKIAENNKNGSGDKDTSSLLNSPNKSQIECDKRIMGQLAQVRQMMADDHMRMLQQLQAQQLKQNA